MHHHPAPVRQRCGIRAAVVVSAVAVLTLGCGTAEDSGDADEAAPSTADSGALTGEDPDETVEGDGNEADAAFVAGMIPHHQGAIEMAALVEDRTERPELRDLADEIVEVQAAEVETLQGMLDRLGGEEGAMVEPDHDRMGMADEAEMEQLAAAEGEEFDRRFLALMITHHEGAIDMAEEVLADGEDAEVAALAEDVIAAQQAEIEQMQRWQQEWGLS
jgi:uncharacterized protein (DUF305 family)